MSYPKEAVNAAFLLLPPKMDTRAARVTLAAIGHQETKYLTRVQYGNGPARGYWQFESGGGVKGVMNHKASADLARKVCHARGIPFVRATVWEALATDDVLAAAFARLLMYTDPFAVPDNAADAWEMYAERCWRPGKPHPETWPAAWAYGLEYAQ
jgi:hypothetical protein